MTERPPRKPDDDADQPVDETAVYPALDPEAHTETHEAPPLDVDDREDPRHELTPDVIELPEHRDDDDSAVGNVDAEPADPPIVEEVEAEQDAEAERFDAWYSEDAVDDQDSPSQATAPAEPATDVDASSDAGDRLRDNDVSDATTPTEDPAPGSDDQANREDEHATPRSGESTSERAAPGSATSRASATASAAADRVARLGSSVGRFGGVGARVRDFVDPRLHVVTTGPHRAIGAVGGVLVLISLLGNSAGLALIVASAIVPLLIVITLAQHDVFESESKVLIAATGVAGGIVGLVAGWLATWNTSSNWFDTGRLNYGAVGFGGQFAEAAGNAPFWVWLLNGLLIPAIVVAALVAGPIALRRWPQFRNEVTDGLILAGTASAGYVVATALVLWSPIISNRGPQTSVGEWTVTVLGVAVVRPIVLVLAGAMLGAGVWKYLMRPNPIVLILPAIGGIGGFLLYSLGSVQTQPAGIWPEFLWITLLAIGAFVLYRIVLDDAVAIDRDALGPNAQRVVCPSCRGVTPNGAFCARCGATLADAAPAPGD